MRARLSQFQSDSGGREREKERGKAKQIDHELPRAKYDRQGATVSVYPKLTENRINEKWNKLKNIMVCTWGTQLREFSRVNSVKHGVPLRNS